MLQINISRNKQKLPLLEPYSKCAFHLIYTYKTHRTIDLSQFETARSYCAVKSDATTPTKRPAQVDRLQIIAVML